MPQYDIAILEIVLKYITIVKILVLNKRTKIVFMTILYGIK